MYYHHNNIFGLCAFAYHSFEINIASYEQNRASPIDFTAKRTIGFLGLTPLKIWPERDSGRARLADRNSAGTIFHQFIE